MLVNLILAGELTTKYMICEHPIQHRLKRGHKVRKLPNVYLYNSEDADTSYRIKLKELDRSIFETCF